MTQPSERDPGEPSFVERQNGAGTAGNLLLIVEYTGENLSRTLSQGAKLIVIDPRLTYLAGRADVWLQLRPGTDTALALGIANVIVNESLYDKEFVGKYVHGWDEFVGRLNEYPPKKVEEIKDSCVTL